MSTEETKASLGPNPTKEEVLQYMGKRYSEISRELDAEIRGERPFKCGWFERKVKGVSRDEENRSDDEDVAIILRDGSEFRGTWGEAKKWLAENEATGDTV